VGYLLKVQKKSILSFSTVTQDHALTGIKEINVYVRKQNSFSNNKGGNEESK
jgi:hypothetical protein